MSNTHEIAGQASSETPTAAESYLDNQLNGFLSALRENRNANEALGLPKPSAYELRIENARLKSRVKELESKLSAPPF